MTGDVACEIDAAPQSAGHLVEDGGVDLQVHPAHPQPTTTAGSRCSAESRSLKGAEPLGSTTTS